jgi:hypothetical protein
MNASTRTAVLLLDAATTTGTFMAGVRWLDLIVSADSVSFHIPGITILGQSLGLPAPMTLRQGFYCQAQSASRVLGVELFYQECVLYPV